MKFRLEVFMAFTTAFSACFENCECYDQPHADIGKDAFGKKVTDNCNGHSSALVLYDEKKVPELLKSKRHLKVDKISLTIQQDWTNLGVAGVVWDSALVLATYLKNEDLSGMKIIELGSGTGFLSIYAAKLGADVVVTDLKGCLPLIQENIKNNIKIDGSDGSILAKELVWGQNLSLFPSGFQVILGSDIVYIEETFDDLIRTLDGLSSCGSKIYLSCKIRYERDNAFIEKLSRTFTVRQVYYCDQKDIHIFLAKKKCFQ